MAIKVTLLGDSIRLIGYGKHVPAMLGDGFEVWQPEDNGRFAEYTLRMIFDEAANIDGSRIIHWNNGLWDMNDLFGDGPFTPEARYVEQMLRIAGILQGKCDRLIFATTTPVYPGNAHHSNERIASFNAALVPELEKRGVIINDLYSLLAPDPVRYIRADDMIHLTDEGERVCAERVTDVIRRAAREL